MNPEDCPLGSLFLMKPKKEPPGAARRAAQAGGILESFLDYRSTNAPLL